MFRTASGVPAELAKTKSVSPEYGLARRCAAGILARLGGIGTSRLAAFVFGSTSSPLWET
jgi:hypothetical protein